MAAKSPKKKASKEVTPKATMACEGRRTSQIWNYFTRLDEHSALCTICERKLSFKTSVSNLKRHLTKKHKDKNFNWKKTQIQIITSDDITTNDQIQWTVINPTAAAPLVNALSTVPLAESFSQQDQLCKIAESASVVNDSTDINKTLLLLFIRDLQPLSIVKDSGFTALHQALNPSYHPPDLHSLSTMVMPTMYEKCLEDVKSMILNEVESLCVTVDVWDTLEGDTYMELTAHYINSNFENRTVLLECTPLSEFCSSDHLASKLNHTMDSWGLLGKVLIVISNSSKVSEAVRKLNWDHFSCFADTINSVVENALSDSCTTKLLQTVAKFVYFLNESDAAKELITKYQLNQGIDNPKELLREGSKKWYSMYYMLQRLVEMRNDIQNSLLIFEEDVPLISNGDWKSCEDLCLILKPFHEACEKMEEEGYLNAGLVLVMTRGLTVVCKKLQEKANLTSLAKMVITKLTNSLSKNFSSIEFNQSLALCTFLDPRFKHHVFTNSTASENVVKYTIQHLSELIKDDDLNLEAALVDTCKSKESFSIWEDVDSVISKVLPQSTPTSKAASEVQRYMKDKLLERDQSETSVEWWRTYSPIYPSLSSLFRRKGCVIATSVSCDRLYCKSKLLLANRRKFLNENELKHLVFLNVNYNFSQSVKDCIF